MGSAVRVPQLSHSLFEPHAFRQTQTAFVIREYARHGVDLLTTPLPVFGAGADVPMEMPIFQGTAALIAGLGVSAETAGRILGLVGFQVTCVLLWVLVRRWFDAGTATVSVALMQFLPFGLAWGASSLIDFSSVAFALGMLVCLDSYVRTGRAGQLLLGAGSAWICALVKVTTALPWCVLLLFAFASVRDVRRPLARMGTALALGPGIAVIAAALWTRFADDVKRGQPATHFLTSGELAAWNFGDLARRTSEYSYSGLGFHAFLEVGGPLGVGVVVAAVGALAGLGSRWHRWGLLASAASAPTVFFNLYVVHSYYWIAVFPMFCTLVALSIVKAAGRLSSSASGRARLAALTTGLMIVAAGAAPIGSFEVFQFLRSPSTPELSVRLAAITRPDEQVLVIGCDWDPTLLYGADRSGFMIRNTTPAALPPPGSIPGYSHLVSCDDTLHPDDYLPEGWRAAPTSDPALYTVERIAP
ncbi:hypothetical protein GCM10009858_30520 [Terrabacter carboxydivorans]|uniref:Glycosyltransferase RgtA/B/C/D-like domain-containing protein n=1 Tax=Terrabacter carboxydivorans TaxID=619730 RepID=A0ABN3LVU3_9MICO